MEFIEVENLELKRQIMSQSNNLYHSAHELTEKDRELEKMEDEFHMQIQALQSEIIAWKKESKTKAEIAAEF